MYIYHALINALSAHVIHINLNMIFYTHVKHSPTKTTHTKQDTERPLPQTRAKALMNLNVYDTDLYCTCAHNTHNVMTFCMKCDIWKVADFLVSGKYFYSVELKSQLQYGHFFFSQIHLSVQTLMGFVPTLCAIACISICACIRNPTH